MTSFLRYNHNYLIGIYLNCVEIENSKNEIVVIEIENNK